MLWILETHAHADHLSAAQHLRTTMGGSVAIGRGVLDVQRTFKRIFGLDAGFAADGSDFDRLLADDERLSLGQFEIQVLPVPGHTNDSVAYLVGDAVFVGDTIFMPDGGTARCDFPGGDAAALYRSVQRLHRLPPATRVFVCHDYSPGGREPRCESSVAEQLAANVHIRDGAEEAFVQMRRARDATLDVPNLLIPAVQVNIRAGRLPPPTRTASATCACRSTSSAVPSDAEQPASATYPEGSNDSPRQPRHRRHAGTGSRSGPKRSVCACCWWTSPRS